MRWLSLSVLIGLMGFAGRAQEPAEVLSKAIAELQADITRDTEALNDLRTRIDAERTPLAQQLDQLRDTVASQRRDLDRVQEVRTRGEREQAELAARTDALEEELRYLRSLFSEYGRATDTRMTVARHPDILNRIGSARNALDQNDGLVESLEALLDASLDWNSERIGGMAFDAAALDAQGLEQPGRFVTFGPAAYFAAADGNGPVGLALLRFGSDTPGIYTDLPPATRAAIRSLTQGSPANVPLDASNGDAIRVAEASPGFIAHLKQGGFTMIPLAGVALAALLLAVWKSLDLARMRLEGGAHTDAVLDALRADQPDAAREHAAHIRRPLRQLVDDLIEHRNAPREHLEEIMHEHVLTSLPFIERNLGALAVLGGVAPLLGLLGTVTGMIHTFQLVTLFGSGDAKLLSGGISEALVTTETGLAIAIPTLLIHAYLARKARGIVGALETQAASMVNDLKLRGPGA